jgi:hypothetical protein
MLLGRKVRTGTRATAQWRAVPVEYEY